MVNRNCGSYSFYIFRFCFLNYLGPAIELEKIKPESVDPEPEVQKTFSEEANTSTYYPAAVPVMDKYILESGKVI